MGHGWNPRRVRVEAEQGGPQIATGDFDPARDGFGFRNPVGVRAEFSEVGRGLFSPFLGRGLCFGMVVAALSGSVGVGASEMERTRRLMDHLARLHLLQFRPPVVAATVSYWLRSGGGRPGYALKRLRVAGSGDPHIICFGPGRERRFIRSLGKSHAVAPYRIERRRGKTRVYVYDPNRPKRENRYIIFDEQRGTFAYEGFTSGNGFGLVLLPLSVVGKVERFSG